jgi:ferredoxin
MAHSISLGNGRRFDCDGQHSVLEAMMARGRTGITVGCRGGGCGVCKVRVVEGRYRTGVMSSACVSMDERQAGVTLACKLFAESDLRLDVLGKIDRVLARSAGDGGLFDFLGTAAVTPAAVPSQGK